MCRWIFGDLKTQLQGLSQCQPRRLVGPAHVLLKLGGSVALAVAGYAVLVPVALFYMLYDWTRMVNSCA
jgi:predicted PurR-regulated permease PerM